MNTATAEMLGRRIDRLKKKLAKVEKDAARYRWLKGQMYASTGWPDYNGYRHWCGVYSSTENLDRAIDQAIDRERSPDETVRP